MTRTLNGCPVCASTRGHFTQVFHRRSYWACDDCRIVSSLPTRIEVPSAITQHIAEPYRCKACGDTGRRHYEVYDEDDESGRGFSRWESAPCTECRIADTAAAESAERKRTEAVILLAQAREKVADWVESAERKQGRRNEQGNN